VSGAPGGLLALDLSTRVGWAYGADFSAPAHGIWELSGGGTSLGARCSALAERLEDAIAVLQPGLVILEAPLPPKAQTAMNSARIQFGLAAVAEMICEEQHVRVEEEKADTVRGFILGRARPQKPEIVAWCKAQGWSPVDHNDGDALMLWRYRHILGRSRVMAGAGSAG